MSTRISRTSPKTAVKAASADPSEKWDKDAAKRSVADRRGTAGLLDPRAEGARSRIEAIQGQARRLIGAEPAVKGKEAAKDEPAAKGDLDALGDRTRRPEIPGRVPEPGAGAEPDELAPPLGKPGGGETAAPELPDVLKGRPLPESNADDPRKGFLTTPILLAAKTVIETVTTTNEWQRDPCGSTVPFKIPGACPPKEPDSTEGDDGAGSTGGTEGTGETGGKKKTDAATVEKPASRPDPEDGPRGEEVEGMPGFESMNPKHERKRVLADPVDEYGQAEVDAARLGRAARVRQNASVNPRPDGPQGGEVDEGDLPDPAEELVHKLEPTPLGPHGPQGPEGPKGPKPQVGPGGPVTPGPV